MLEISGIELLPDWPVFLSFVLAGLALNIVPGADMTFIIASAARGGRRDGIDRLARGRRRRAGPHLRRGARPVGDPRLVAGGVQR